MAAGNGGRGRLSHRGVGRRSDRKTRPGSRDGSGGSPRNAAQGGRPMWRLIPGGTWATRTLVILLVLAQVDAAPILLAAAPKKKKAEPVVLKVEETVGDLAYVLQGAETKVEGVGLVAGL